MIGKCIKIAMMAAGLTTILLGTQASASVVANMELDFRNVNDEINSRDPGQPFSGGLWYSASGDVVGDHNLSASNPDIPAGSPLASFSGGNGHFAAQWGFSVSGSSGDTWDAILASTNPVTFGASWDGAIYPEPGVTPIDVKEIFFSHIFANGSDVVASLGSWINNNNNAATPGDTLPDVWTYVSLDSLDPLTGSNGTFGVVANDPDDVMGLGPFFSEYQTDLAFIDTSGSGQLAASAVPVPATLGLLGIGLAGIGFVTRRRRLTA